MAGRAARLPVVYWDLQLEGWHQFTGGEASRIAFEESRLCFVHGAFLGCLMLVQVCLEHMLIGLFRMEGDDEIERLSYRTLLGRARDHRYLSGEEWDLFERLRTVRNPYVHSRPPTSAEWLPTRALASESSIPDLLEADARQAVTALMSLMRRPPFIISAGQS